MFGNKKCLLRKSLVILLISVNILFPYIYFNLKGVSALDYTTLRIGVDMDAAPMEYEDGGEAKGFNVELMKQVSQIMDIPTDFIFMSWTDVLESVKNESLDIMFAIDTDERRNDYDFSIPILNISWRIFVKSNVYGISDINDLEGRTVAVVNDFASHTYLLDSGVDIHIVPVDNVDEGLELLDEGDVFAFVGNYHLASYYIQEGNYINFKVIGDVIDEKKFSIAVKKGNSELLGEINSSLTELFQNGKYEEIYEKWYGSGVNLFFNENAIRWLIIFVIVLGCSILLLISWNHTLKVRVRDKTEEISKNLELFQKIAEFSPYPIMIIDNMLKIRFINKSFTEVFGYTIEETENMTQFIDKVSIKPLTKNKILLNLRKMIESKKIREESNEKLKIQTKFGKQIIISYRPIKLSESMYFYIFENITEREKQENEKLRIQRLESISLLAGGIAHDFNNILMTLLGSVNLMQLEDNIPTGFIESLNQMEKALQRANSITNQLLTFSKGGNPVKKILSIETVIDDSLTFTMHGSNCIYEKDFQNNLPKVEIDPGQISQVINNLVINAQQSMPDGGLIKVRGQKVKISQKDKLSIQDGNYVKIAIEDQGRGIPSNLQENIFDPYFTTKPKGTGLGLATAYSIIKKHNGFIDFNSTEGIGTEFYFLLPAIIDDNQNNHKRILIMDDDSSVLKILDYMIGGLGYEVEFASNGEETLEKYNNSIKDGNMYKFLILDLTIPGGMGGAETMKKLLNIDPKVQVIVTSGYLNAPEINFYRDYGFIGVLKKPFTYEELKEIIDNFDR